MREEQPVSRRAKILGSAQGIADPRGATARGPEFRRPHREEQALADRGEIRRGRAKGDGVDLLRHALHHPEQVERHPAAAYEIGGPGDVRKVREVGPDTRAGGVPDLKGHGAAGVPKPAAGSEVEGAVHVRQVRRRGKNDAGIIFDSGGPRRRGRIIHPQVVGAPRQVPQVDDGLRLRHAPAFRREHIRKHPVPLRGSDRQRAAGVRTVGEGEDRQRLRGRSLDADRQARPAVQQELPHGVGEIHLRHRASRGIGKERGAGRVRHRHHAVALQIQHLDRERRERTAAKILEPLRGAGDRITQRIAAIQLASRAGDEEELGADGAELQRAADRHQRAVRLDRVHRGGVCDVEDGGARADDRGVEDDILDGRQIVQRLQVLGALHKRCPERVEEFVRHGAIRRHMSHEEERPADIQRLDHRRAGAGESEARVRRAERARRSAAAPLPQLDARRHTRPHRRGEEDARAGGREVPEAHLAGQRRTGAAHHRIASAADDLQQLRAGVEDEIVAEEHEVVRRCGHRQAANRRRRRTGRNGDVEFAGGFNPGVRGGEIDVGPDHCGLGGIAVAVRRGVRLDGGKGRAVGAAIELDALRAARFQRRQVKGRAEHLEAGDLGQVVGTHRHPDGGFIRRHAEELHGSRRVARQEVEEASTGAGEGAEDLDVVTGQG